MRRFTILFCLVYASVNSNWTFSKYDIQWMTTMHYHFCKDQTPCLQQQQPYSTDITPRSRPAKTLIELPEIPDMLTICCESCSCNISECVANSDCCPEMLDYTQSLDRHRDIQIEKCILPQLKPLDKKYPNTYESIKMITSCPYKTPKDERGNLHVDKCLNSSLYTDVYTKVPVADILTNTVYLNRYCAYCNGLEYGDFIYWRAEILCKYGNFIPERFETLVYELILSENCNLIATAPDTREYFSCTYPGISKCNETGKWVTYDLLIEQACSAYIAVFQRTYRNVFCYLCNENEDLIQLRACQSSLSTQVTFTMLLKLESDNERRNQENERRNQEITDVQGDDCSKQQFYDPIQGKCVRMKCKDLKVLIGGDCRNIAEKIGGIKYAVFLKLTTLQTIAPNYFSDMLQNLYGILATFFANKSPAVYSIDIFQKDSQRQGKQSLENDFDYIVVYIRFYLYLPELTNISFIDEILSLHETTLFVPFLNRQKRLKLTVEIDLFPFQFEINFLNLSTPFATRVLVDYMDNRPLTPVLSDLEIDMMPDKPENVLLPVHNCPLVELNASFYHIFHHIRGIFVQELNTEFSKSEYLTEHFETGPESTIRTDTHILICKDKIQSLFEAYASRQNTEPGVQMYPFLILSSRAGILAVVSVGISVCCLLASFACTLYARFMTKETEFKHIYLTVSLTCSQLLFLFGIGQSSHVPQWACKLIGVLVHYSWLVTVLWINICSYYLYRKFTSRTTAAPLRNYRLSLSLFCMLTAFVPVVINIVISLARAREDIGYGGVLCFISEFRMTLLCFGLPIFFILFINLLWYFAVLIKVNNILTLSALQIERCLLHCYSILSTLMLLTLGFEVLYMDVGFDFLVYIFLVCQSGQGIVVLIATLYCHFFRICVLQ